MAGLKLRGNVRVSSVKMKCDVGRGKCMEVRSVECGVSSVKCGGLGVWNVKHGVRSVKLEVWSVMDHA